MRKSFLFVLLIMVGALIAGCSNDGPITLVDEQGKDVVFENMERPALVFFFSGVQWDYCKSQLVELQKKKELFSQFPGDIYAVSVATVREHKNYKEKLGLDYPLLSDENLDLIRKVELVDPNSPKSKRGFAVLDKNGKVLHAEEVDPFGDNAEEVIKFAVQKLEE